MHGVSVERAAMPLPVGVVTEFVYDWRQAWNSHDVDRVIAHYHDDVEYASPFIAHPGRRRLRGREELRRYVTAAFERVPQLSLPAPRHVAIGLDSVTVIYDSHHGSVAAEVLVLDEHLRIRSALCHYDPPPAP